MGFFANGLKKEFETAVVNEPSVFQPLKFYCIQNLFISTAAGVISTAAGVFLPTLVPYGGRETSPSTSSYCRLHFLVL